MSKEYTPSTVEKSYRVLVVSKINEPDGSVTMVKNAFGPYRIIGPAKARLNSEIALWGSTLRRAQDIVQYPPHFSTPRSRSMFMRYLDTTKTFEIQESALDWKTIN
jgi:hypothetical protein